MPEKSLEDYFFYGPFLAAFLFVTGGWYWAWSALRGIDSPLILHFSEYTGINQIGGMQDIHGLGATGIVVLLVNFFLARSLREDEPRWTKILSGATIFLAALLFTSLAAIISVNQ